MATRTVTGTLYHADSSPWAGATVRFAMDVGTFTLTPDVTYLQDAVTATTIADGTFTVDLTSGLSVYWRCALPDGEAFLFGLSDGAPITLEELRAFYAGIPVPIAGNFADSDFVVTSPLQGQMLGSNGTQFVNRTPAILDLVDFGAVSGGELDAPLAAAIGALPAAGGTLLLGPGTYTLTTTQAATKFVRLVGQGIGHIASGGPSAVTTIQWAGGAGKMFTSDAWTNAWSFSDLCLDGNGAATHAVHATAMVDQHWGATGIIGCITVGLLLEGLNDNTHFNVFDKLVLAANSPTGTAMEWKGNGTGNVCHNVFHHIQISFTGDVPGMLCGDSDNNTVGLIFVYHNSGDAYGVDLATSCRANYFWHVEMPSGAKPMIARAGTFNDIANYDTSNGQNEPVLEGDAVLNWHSTFYGSHMQRITVNNADSTNVYFNWFGSSNHYIRGGNTDVDTTLHVSKAFSLIDGLTAPATVAGKAFIYVDTADGSLKVKFGSGTVKTIETDP